MKLYSLLFVILLFRLLGTAQIEFYGFDNVTSYNSWNYETNMNPTSWSYDASNQRINYTVNANSIPYQTSEQFISRELVNPVGFQFIASFKLNRQISGTNSYFPIMLTPAILTGNHLHPWRQNPPSGGVLGPQQNVGLLGVIITHNNIGIIHRTDGMTNGAVATLSGYTLPISQDVWIRMERVCATTVKLEVYSDASMTNLLAGQTFTVNNPGNSLEGLYIANCNGNGTTTIADDMLDDYKIETVTLNLPTFNAVGPYCSGANVPALPSTSINGISGSWSPNINNTTTTTYTFTPNNNCFSQTTMDIEINPSSGAPTFNITNSICAGTMINQLPTTSQNGFTGAWSPALNNQATTTYTFTPGVGQCATNTAHTINVTPAINPTFSAVNPICIGENLAPLPSNSLNGISGSWAPPVNNQTTTNYTFSPSSGQCATSTSLTIDVNSQIASNFTPVPSICSGSNLNPLPLTSLNNITGTWSPTLDNQNTTTYTFTPNNGQCASTSTMVITVNQNNAIPSFDPCAGTVISNLPTTSIEGFTGSWSTNSSGISNNYTFTPDAGQCAISADVTFLNSPTSSFSAANVCLGNTMDFTNSSTVSSGNIMSTNWDFGDGNTSADFNPVHLFNAAGQYDVLLITEAENQCIDSVTMFIEVYPIPAADFEFNTPCENQPINFIDLSTINGSTGSVITNWDWSFGIAAPSSTLQNPTINTQDNTPVTADLTVTSSNGCENTYSDIVQISPIPEVSFTSSQPEGCSGLCVFFTGNVTISSGVISSTTWTFGDGQISTELNPEICFNNTDSIQQNISVQLSASSDAGCLASYNSSDFITLYGNVIADFDANYSNGVSEFQNLSTNAANSNWAFDIYGTSNEHSTSFIFPALNQKTFETCLFVSSVDGCSDSICKSVSIEEDLGYYVPNAFTPNNDGVNDLFTPVLTEISANEFEFLIFDRWGVLVFETNDIDEASWDGTYQSVPVPEDVYVWRIKGENRHDRSNFFNVSGHVTVIR